MPENNVTRSEVLDLMKEKEKLESELEALSSVLKSQGVGMEDSLVDNQDCPRSDIDVYQVRHTRHDIRTKTTDLKEVMKKIESGLHNLHQQAREGLGVGDNAPATEKRDIPKPFARVLVVCPGSPAEEAGVKQEDLIARFGSVTVDNFTSLKSISDVVEHSRNTAVPLTLIRDGCVHRVQLTPRTWSGQGLLGFKIRPVSVEPER
eukprot:TRINITY_DN41375_c0_g1_i1.p1 TRINITY_DN41375_c0_g1~~TRINITY_DN41375_c0_g1_i1.p1  ORF type:complete len:205 (-),score=14.65 TRINITY_DN41375_c0_g1_i1:183-797(-)